VATKIKKSNMRSAWKQEKENNWGPRIGSKVQLCRPDSQNYIDNSPSSSFYFYFIFIFYVTTQINEETTWK
jgi:hypothetical protein